MSSNLEGQWWYWVIVCIFLRAVWNHRDSVEGGCGRGVREGGMSSISWNGAGLFLHAIFWTIFTMEQGQDLNNLRDADGDVRATGVQTQGILSLYTAQQLWRARLSEHDLRAKSHTETHLVFLPHTESRQDVHNVNLKTKQDVLQSLIANYSC